MCGVRRCVCARTVPGLIALSKMQLNRSKRDDYSSVKELAKKWKRPSKRKETMTCLLKRLRNHSLLEIILDGAASI